MVSSVRTRRAFEVLSSSRNRARSGPIWVVRADASGVDLDERDGVCAAYSVGKAVGSAVVRNRVRRRLRAAMAQLERDDVLTPGLYLVGTTAGVVDEPFRELGDHLARAVAGTR